MFRKTGLFSSKDKGLSWWWLGIKVGVVTALIIWWWLENRNKQFIRESASEDQREDIQSIPLPLEDDSQDEIAPDKETQSTFAQSSDSDDLRRIEGIGPKINATLQAAGIRTYLQLAGLEPAKIKQILVEAGIRIGFPETWPEQAALADKADWSALEEFQSKLQGGRRVN